MRQMHSSKACQEELGWYPPLHALVEAEGWHYDSCLGEFIDKQPAISVKEIIDLKIACTKNPLGFKYNTISI